MPDTSFPSLDAPNLGSTAARPQVEAGSAPVADSARSMTLFVMTVATLYFGREVLVPVTLALLLAFVLAPLVGLLRHLRIGRVPSVGLDGAARQPRRDARRQRVGGAASARLAASCAGAQCAPIDRLAA